ncbi:P-loop containing nucleoside triphosphate hydrolase protein [Karstenula rhodostoma CBS 690.94]|uniref:P-loop containing nucleoside triphosphate hydrolase protein n=1 Tax=Karstenula rhodostoma CBS 690.94 TaxID=1392251 RepID=A0A9P4U6P9_9PLEO|nr:P-loop containing nucleoside triphosphate hydrolase protein [Karstenula rhodostoma CBS 690.94]
MALTAVQTAMNLEEKQNVHPFFSKPHKTTAPEPQPPSIEAPANNAEDDPDYEQHEKAGKAQKKRGRKPGSANKKKESPAGKSQALMERFTQPARSLPAAEGAHVDAEQILGEPNLEQDPNQDRRKRRKTNSPPPTRGSTVSACVPENASLDWHQQLELEAAPTMASQNTPANLKLLPNRDNETLPADGHGRPATPPIDASAEPSTSAAQCSNSTSPTSRASPKKKIKISRSGKLVSSPPPGAEPEATPPKKRRGRKPKLKAIPTVTIIRYGQTAQNQRAIGEKIDAILRGENLALRPVTPKKAPAKPSGPPKPTHPFFLGKPAHKPDEAAAGEQATDGRSLPSPRAQKKSAVTPGKLKLQSQGFHSSVDPPAFGGRTNHLPKQAGLIEAAWPAKDIAHVRNLNVVTPLESNTLPKTPSLKARKLKNRVLTVSPDEDLISRLAAQLRHSIRKQNDAPHSDFAPPEDVRLPTRLLTTGVSIQEKIRTQILSLSPSIEQGSSAHPATAAIFAGIQDNLTAFDLGKCEALSWVQKYAPQYSSHVLQLGKEPATLKDWLQSLKVLAVSGKHSSEKAFGKPPKKKRKTVEDDFIVDSDEEEEEEMVELYQEDCENHETTFAPASLRRVRWTRNKNVVLISGPHGCGKSAMVQAVAKDLGFEIFEIHSGSRRSGKDIQDKVGDMTANHLVSHNRVETLARPEAIPVDDTDTERHSDALRKDLDSGRQGTVMSFFKSKGPAAEKPKPITKAQEPTRKVTSSGQATLPIAQSQRKSQKQSLILFEEADILYDEDQGFWAQVTRLASHSKRPIIITCTNEALIPVHELPLAAILRVSPPPMSLATDYMVAMAGHEGHILERDAVSTLYRSRNCDLRASITELNLWCQMSVGDRKGGLEWIYQRWPPGKDMDESGRPLRVASEGTYMPGMGCLSHNVFESQDHIGFDRTEELLKETWDEWDVKPNEWSGFYDIGSVSHEQSRGRVDELKRLESIIDSTSAADVFCCAGMPSYEPYFKERTDPSLPQLTEKARLSYTLAAPVLQVDHVADFSHFDTRMLTQTHLQVQRTYGGQPFPDAEQSVSMPSTEQAFTSAILDHKLRQTCGIQLSRPDFSRAFDILACPPDTLPALNTSYNLTASSFDRTFRIVVEDLAPYVRSIVASELVLESQRIRLGNLLSEGGRSGNKRQRTTRAARTALEGGSRDTKRRERWFGAELNRALAMGTAGEGWAGMGFRDQAAEGSESVSVAGTQEE